MEETLVKVTNAAPYAKKCGKYLLPPGVAVAVPMSFVAEYGYDNELKVDYSAMIGMLRSHTDDGRPSFDFWCPLSSVDGYGRHALDIYRGLQALNVDVALRNGGYFIDRQFLPTQLAYQAVANQAMPPSKVGLSMTVPYDPGLWRHESLTKVGITQFETDRFPERHVEQVNKLHHLIVTSHFQPSVMRYSGVTVPISVLTPGVDTDYFAYRERPRDGLFKVLILGALTNRKNPMTAIRTFIEASANNPDWRLTIKTRKASGIEEVRRFARMDSRITFLMSDSPPDEVREFYWRHDCLLWPSKGEGVGLPPLEAMSTGMELVCSDNSGMRDFLGTWAWPIKTSHMERADGPGDFSAQYVDTYGSVGRWWVPDQEHAIDQLRACYAAWSAGKGRGKMAAQYVRDHHTLRLQAKSVLDVVERYL